MRPCSASTEEFNGRPVVWPYYWKYIQKAGSIKLQCAKEVGGRGRVLEGRGGGGPASDLVAEGLVHLREQGELHEGHAAQSEEERNLGHSLVHGDQIVA